VLISETALDDYDDIVSEENIFAVPKSASFIYQFSSRRILAGFKSLCAIN